MSDSIRNSENNSELFERQDSSENVPLKKKRKVLKRTEIKQARVKGQKYVNYKGQEKPEAQLVPNCK